MAGHEPGGDSGGAIPAGLRAVPEPPVAAAAGASDTIRFFCATCGSSLKDSASARGQLRTCLYCLRETPVPWQPLTADETPHPASLFEHHRILSLTMRFLCPWCASKLAVDARAGGALAECPQCGKEVRVPALPGLAPPVAPPSESVPAPQVTAEPQAAGLLTADEIRFLTMSAPSLANA